MSIEGSGRDATRITSGATNYVLQAYADLNLSHLAVESAVGGAVLVIVGQANLLDVRLSSRPSPGFFASGIRVVAAGHASLKDVSVDAVALQSSAEGIGLFSDDTTASVLDGVAVKATSDFQGVGIEVQGYALLNNVRIEATNFGVEVIATGQTPPVIALTNCHVEGSGLYGLITASNGSSTLTIENSSLVGANASINLDSLSQANTRIAHTRLSGPVFVNAPNTLTCVGAYGAAFQALDSACQPLPQPQPLRSSPATR